MKALDLLLHLALCILIYTILTLPHFLLMLTGVGYQYSLGGILFCSFLSVVLTPLIFNKIKK
jgi:hypothetical protein